MKPQTRTILISAWVGFALAALLLYPLAAALNDDIYYLQWQRRDFGETVVALLLLALVFGAAVHRIWPRQSRASTIALLAVAALPLASLAAGVLPQLPFDNALRAAGESRAITVLVTSAVAAAIVIPLSFWPEAFARWLRGLVLVVSPVSLVVVQALVASTGHAAPTVRVEGPAFADGTPDSPLRGRGFGEASQGRPTVTASCSSVLALLFDELSFAYMYLPGPLRGTRPTNEGPDIRPEFPGIRSFASRATNYLAVTSPGKETLVSLPGYLAARKLIDVRVENNRLVEVDAEGGRTPFNGTMPDGLFATARRLGFTTEAAGYYLPYCDLIGDLADTCRSFSFYNTSTVSDRFSPAHPVLTTLILWPRQYPFGLFKNPAFAWLQRNLVDQTLAFAMRPIDPRAQAFRFVHFSIPHLPFVFDAEGYNPPFDPLRTSPDRAYMRQTEYVDRLVARIVAGLQQEGRFDDLTVALLSDHGFRFGGRETMPLHIPFIVKQRGQTSRVDVRDELGGERLLRDVVTDACDGR